LISWSLTILDEYRKGKKLFVLIYNRVKQDRF
jgi:hypothetical protein